ncbi:MAG: hypothetical protein FJ301_05715 [Planctomycetes bacterium]|nr:hypothetical protein [Planctomycetota bacterium]
MLNAPRLPLPAAIAAVAALLSSVSSTTAQTPVTGQPVILQRARLIRGTTVVGKPLAMPAVPAETIESNGAMATTAPQDPAAAAAAASANQRVQKWKQLQWDRRPSSILQAWSLPELKPYDPAEEKDKPQPAGAVAPTPPPAANEQAVEGEPSAEELAALLAQLGGDAPPEVRAELEQAIAAARAKAPAAGAAELAAAANEQQLVEKRLQRECEMVQRAVTLGRWEAVGAFLATLPEKERAGCYEHFLKALLTPPPRQEDQRVPPNLQEKNRFGFDDALALAGLAPGGFDKKQVPALAPIVQRALEGGSVLEVLLAQLAAEVAKPAAAQRLDRREAALLLSAIGQEVEMGPFLPTLAEAEAQNDREALNLMARHALARFQKEKRNEHLETAWTVTQAALAKGDIGEAEKAEALRRAVELAPKVRDDLGPAWLAESFTARPERGMEIVATIGGQVAKGFSERPGDLAYRANGLKLQKTAVEAVLAKAPQLAAQWQPTLGLLASGWIVEASYSQANSQSDMLGPVLERDEFGNMFYTQRRRGGGGQVQAIEPADLVEAQPGAEWAALLPEALQPHFATVSAQLFLKVNEPEKAFPFIAKLGASNPRLCKELANEFLRVWTRTHNPNADGGSRTNPYMFMYGFDERSNGIPLTRSKQQRNLAELGEWVERLRGLPIDGVDEQLLTQAFVGAHSVAEVYRLETIQKVFGDVGAMDPVLLGYLLGTMRRNLATVWRLPAVQEQQKTKRSQKETLAEVQKGYATALTIAQQALQARGRHWALLAVVASLLHDGNNFAKETKRDSGFAEARRKAFDLFAEGAKHYAEVAGALRVDQETIRPFDTWFYAALGASDLGAVDEETVLAASQLPLIRAAIDALPAGARERHLGMFANQLFTRMSAVKPQVKFRYLEAGFAVCGDHPQAVEAKKVWDYYQDLLGELKLVASVDGSTQVGTQPFGLQVDIVHSPEIERESGGFQKYATNQNNQPYAYNYGRPLENYCDKFQEAASAALDEHFEVLSVTFNSEGMDSAPTDDPAWRRSPYAYLLLKARGPQVDRVPEIKLDFDFLDTSGFTILPVGSSPVVIDAAAAAEPRPFADLEVTQLLDQRKADEGKITLEIKAKAKGLVPALDAILQLDLPGFRVKKTDDQGASVSRLAEDRDGVVSERVWLLSLEPADGGAPPSTFTFGKPKVDGCKAVYQRYDDADLATVDPQVALGQVAAEPLWAYFVLAATFAAYFGWFFLIRAKAPGGAAGPAIAMPETVTPFSTLAVLAAVAARARLDAAGQRELADDQARIEAACFGRADDPALDLRALAAKWIHRVG